MARKIVIANQKGGVAKTTTTGAMAAGLKLRGKKVLAVDVDPQGNLSESIGADNNINTPTVYELLKEEVAARNAIQTFSTFDIIPANILLASADIEFIKTGKEYLLKEALTSIESFYDYIIIDTPPSLGIMTVNAFAMANEILIPTKAEVFSTSGIIQLFNSVNTVKKYCNPDLCIRGILITMYNPRARVHQDIKVLTETIGDSLDAPIFNTYIRSSITVSEAQAYNVDIFTYSNKNNVSMDYAAFLDEYLEGVN